MSFKKLIYPFSFNKRVESHSVAILIWQDNEDGHQLALHFMNDRENKCFCNYDNLLYKSNARG